MGRDELKCPICDGDLPLGGDERAGDELFCSFCGAPSEIKGNPDDEECELETDF
ncbi:MAG: hypothetical protein V3T33_05505 [Myxococcota bacterium]